jgi:catalase
MSPHEQAHIIAAFSFELSHCDDPVVYKAYTALLNNIDFQLAKTVASNVGGVAAEKPLRPNHGTTSKLSQKHYVPKSPTIASRRVAILVADGFNATEVEALRGLFSGAGAVCFVIAPRRGRISAASSLASVEAHHTYEGQRSTLFDALFIPGGAEHAKTLSENGRAVHWIREAFGHCKAIGAIGEG